jgi:hypothetical protein
MTSGALRWLYSVLILGCAFCAACATGYAQTGGSSEVVLVDLSKSFMPLTRADQRAIEAVAAATSNLGGAEWPSPVSILWSRIESASLVAAPLCGPFEFGQKLIKTGKGLDAVGFTHKLQDCSQAVIEAARRPSSEAPYTDISGGVALASQQVQSARSERRYIVVISDFVEDLPKGRSPVPLHLAGEHILLLHRTGTQEPITSDHLDRVQSWVEKLQLAGAATVVSLPLHSATPNRIAEALNGEKKGTNVVVLQNLPDTARPDGLLTIADAITTSAREWASPVTVTWVDVRPKTERSSQMPLAEFAPRLIKVDDNYGKLDFFAQVKEMAAGMQRFAPGASNADLSGAIRHYAAAGKFEVDNVLIIASNFPDIAGKDNDVHVDLSRTRVVMLPGSSHKDESDQNAYLRRLNNWQKWFVDRHASVCRRPINGLTESPLDRCLHEH